MAALSVNAGLIDRTKLRYVTVNDRCVGNVKFPDFFILGPQRTGTTWLHANLEPHPRIMMPSFKETHYFSTLNDHSSKYHHSTELAWYLSHFSESPRRRLKKSLRRLLAYGELYHPHMYGEACASYAALPKEIIRDIANLNPRLRLVMIVRDPVMRAWSHAKKDLILETGRSIDEISDKEFEKFFTDIYIFRCSLFTENIEYWTNVFGPQNLFIGWFSDIQTQPVTLLSDVMAFLGVAGKNRYITRNHRRVIYSTPDITIPPRLLRFLEELHSDERAKLLKRFGRCN